MHTQTMTDIFSITFSCKSVKLYLLYAWSQPITLIGCTIKQEDGNSNRIYNTAHLSQKIAEPICVSRPVQQRVQNLHARHYDQSATPQGFKAAGVWTILLFQHCRIVHNLSQFLSNNITKSLNYYRKNYAIADKDSAQYKE